MIGVLQLFRAPPVDCWPPLFQEITHHSLTWPTG